MAFLLAFFDAASLAVHLTSKTATFSATGNSSANHNERVASKAALFIILLIEFVFPYNLLFQTNIDIRGFVRLNEILST